MLDMETSWAKFCGGGELNAACRKLAEHSQVKKFSTGETVIKQADTVDTVYLIQSGQLRSAKYSENGHKIWLAEIGEGALVGEVSALISQPRSSFVEAVSDVVALAISGSVFLTLSEEHGVIGIALARMLAERLYQTSNQLMEMTALPVPSRLHAELIRLGVREEEGGDTLFIADLPPVIILAERIHTSRETASRALTTLEDKGLIKRKGNSVHVFDPFAS